MLTGKLSSHLVRTHRHLSEGTQVTQIEETLLMLGGTHTELSDISSIRLGDYEVWLDHGTQTARHPHHSDPAIMFEADGRTNLQIFFHDLKPTDAGDKLLITRAGGAKTEQRCMWEGSAVRPTLQTEMSIKPGQRPLLRITCSEMAEVIVQRLLLGRIVEDRHELMPGRHEVSIPAAFADVLGVAVSTSDLMNGIEHKHMLLGKFGAPSGRHLLINGKCIEHGVDEKFLYRAALAVADANGRPGGVDRAWQDFDELDVWCTPAQAAQVRSLMEHCPCEWTVTTYGRADGMDGVPDVLTIAANDPLPLERPTTFMLFADAASDDFAQRLLRVASRQHEFTPSHRILDLQWLGANRHPVNDRRRFGIAYSLPTDEPLTQARVREFKRVNLVDKALPQRASAGSEASVPFPGPIPASSRRLLKQSEPE